MTEMDITFHAMGSDVRLIIGAPLLRKLPSPAHAAERERAFVESFAAKLSRFRADSELTALNESAAPAHPASPLLRAAVQASLWAARRSGGLVDPTLADALEQAGYVGSLDGAEPASLRQALSLAPARRPAQPDPSAAWRSIVVDRTLVRRPAGLRIDNGGTGKGLCADAVAHRLGSYSRFVVDCGGDIAIGGFGAQLQPFQVAVEHPLTGEVVLTLPVASGGVATSGLNVRVWRTPEGGFNHHLIDPMTRRPAWTGLIAASALGGSALEAETLSKVALLLGPEGARRALSQHGGVIFHDDGEVEQIGLQDRLR